MNFRNKTFEKTSNFIIHFLKYFYIIFSAIQCKYANMPECFMTNPFFKNLLFGVIFFKMAGFF